MRYSMVAGAVLIAAAMVSGSAFAGGDAANGKAVFEKTCKNCHSTEIGVNKVGPSLWDVVGRHSASVPDFVYSDALKGANRTWDAKELDSYLSDPRGTMHGVKMFFKGLPDAGQRADVISYLATLK